MGIRGFRVCGWFGVGIEGLGGCDGHQMGAKWVGMDVKWLG